MVIRNLFLLFFFQSLVQALPVYASPLSYCNNRSLFHQGFHTVAEVIKDAVHLNMNIFSLDTIKVITSFVPLYLSTRMVDERLQDNFYHKESHKNLLQLPKVCHHSAHYGVAVPMIFLSSLTFFGWTKDLRTTARIYAIGLPFVQSGKDCIKKLSFKACLRPWHEDFDRNKRSLGGFPSGHMANVTYAATLFGMRYGWRWALPLASFATFVFADFCNSNRHYLSQLVAGVGLGVVFALAANTLIEKKLNDIFKCSFQIDAHTVGVRASYCF